MCRLDVFFFSFSVAIGYCSHNEATLLLFFFPFSYYDQPSTIKYRISKKTFCSINKMFSFIAIIFFFPFYFSNYIRIITFFYLLSKKFAAANKEKGSELDLVRYKKKVYFFFFFFFFFFQVFLNLFLFIFST